MYSAMFFWHFVFLPTVLSTGNFCGTTGGCIYPSPTRAVQGVPTTTPPSLDPTNFRSTCLPLHHSACAATILPAFDRLVKQIFIRQGAVQTSPSRVVALEITLQSTVSTHPGSQGRVLDNRSMLYYFDSQPLRVRVFLFDPQPTLRPLACVRPPLSAHLPPPDAQF